jgi:hypothetical protein
VFATTQNKARLGETCSELQLDVPEGVQTQVHSDKMIFSMMYVNSGGRTIDIHG